MAFCSCFCGVCMCVHCHFYIGTYDYVVTQTNGNMHIYYKLHIHKLFWHYACLERVSGLDFTWSYGSFDLCLYMYYLLGLVEKSVMHFFWCGVLHFCSQKHSDKCLWGSNCSGSAKSVCGEGYSWQYSFVPNVQSYVFCGMCSGFVLLRLLNYMLVLSRQRILCKINLWESNLFWFCWNLKAFVVKVTMNNVGLILMWNHMYSVECVLPLFFWGYWFTCSENQQAEHFI